MLNIPKALKNPFSTFAQCSHKNCIILTGQGKSVAVRRQFGLSNPSCTKLSARTGRHRPKAGLCTFDKDIATWGVPTRIVQASRVNHDRTLSSAVDQEQRRPACRTEAPAHGMATISRAFKPAWLTHLDLEVGLFDQHRREVGTAGCLLRWPLFLASE